MYGYTHTYTHPHHDYLGLRAACISPSVASTVLAKIVAHRLFHSCLFQPTFYSRIILHKYTHWLSLYDIDCLLAFFINATFSTDHWAAYSTEYVRWVGMVQKCLIQRHYCSDDWVFSSGHTPSACAGVSPDVVLRDRLPTIALSNFTLGPWIQQRMHEWQPVWSHDCHVIIGHTGNQVWTRHLLIHMTVMWSHLL